MTLTVAPSKEQGELLSEAAGTKTFGGRRPYPGAFKYRIGQAVSQVSASDGGGLARSVAAQARKPVNRLWCSSSAFRSPKSEVEI